MNSVGEYKEAAWNTVTDINPLPTNDAPMRHDLCELSINL